MIFDPIIALDLHVNALLLLLHDPVLTNIFLLITWFGEVELVGIFALIVSAFLWRAEKKYQILALWLTIIGSEGLTFLLKIAIQRPRPLNALVLETSNAFPSGHATVAIAFYGFVTYILMQKIHQKKYRIFLGIFSVLCILAIGFSRLYLGVHYVSDIFVGYSIGLLGLVCGISLSENKIFEAKFHKLFGKK